MYNLAIIKHLIKKLKRIKESEGTTTEEKEEAEHSSQSQGLHHSHQGPQHIINYRKIEPYPEAREIQVPAGSEVGEIKYPRPPEIPRRWHREI